MICILFIAYIASVVLAKISLNHMHVHKISHFKIFQQLKILVKIFLFHNAYKLFGPLKPFHHVSGTDEISHKIFKIFTRHLELC